ncbi:MAG TPA: MFS transporter [Chthoniobacteraceae bacterium]|jgi:sugar phosphate permease|nr:MFS transporter [Chthoniobacteraceae bacterium]
MFHAPRKGAKVRRFQWISVALLVLVGIINLLDRSTLSIANTYVRADLHISDAQMGFLLSAFSLAYAFAQLPVGVALDRMGSRLVLGVGLCVWSVAQLCGGLVTSFHQFIVARVVLGIGESPTFPAGAKMIANWFNQRERGTPTGVFLSAPTISPMLAPPILTGLTMAYGWRNMFIIMGVAGIVLSVIWYVIARDRKDVELTPEENSYFDGSSEPEAPKRVLSFAEWRGLFTQPTMWGIVLGFVGVIYGVWLYLTWLPDYLKAERHLTFAKVGVVACIPYIFATLGALSSGVLADWLLDRGANPINSRKWPICLGLLGGAGFSIPFAYASATTTAIVWLCFVLFFLYLASAGAWALVNVATPGHMIATVGGFQNFGGYLGGSLAPIITGWLKQHTGSFRASLLLSAAVAFVAAFVYLLLVRAPIRDIAPDADK